jgi:hypothetical protein
MAGNKFCTKVDWDENREYLEAWKEVIINTSNDTGG